MNDDAYNLKFLPVHCEVRCCMKTVEDCQSVWNLEWQIFLALLELFVESRCQKIKAEHHTSCQPRLNLLEVFQVTRIWQHFIEGSSRSAMVGAQAQGELQMRTRGWQETTGPGVQEVVERARPWILEELLATSSKRSLVVNKISDICYKSVSIIQCSVISIKSLTQRDFLLKLKLVKDILEDRKMMWPHIFIDVQDIPV